MISPGLPPHIMWFTEDVTYFSSKFTLRPGRPTIIQLPQVSHDPPPSLIFPMPDGPDLEDPKISSGAEAQMDSEAASSSTQ